MEKTDVKGIVNDEIKKFVNDSLDKEIRLSQNKTINHGNYPEQPLPYEDHDEIDTSIFYYDDEPEPEEDL